MNQKERMLKELPYKAWLDGLPEERMKIKLKIYEYNHLKPPEESIEICSHFFCPFYKGL